MTDTAASLARMQTRRAARQRQRHIGRRLVALALAIGVPAIAAPTDWQALLSAPDKASLVPAAKAMPFEEAGQSFPGSAFYYLEDAPRVDYAQASETAAPLFDQSGTGDPEAAAQLGAASAGPAARAFFASGNFLSQGRALQCLTDAIYYEAASEPDAGQRAVAQVVLNRVAHPSFPNSVCGVVFQGSERATGCQFSFTCDGSMRRKPSVAGWARAERIAREALAGYVFKPVGLATHYHTIWIYPYWAPSLEVVGTIGAHRFYRWRGLAGQSDAFRSAYAGNEPAAAPKPRAAGATDASPTAAADPIALARAYEEARQKALAESARAATPQRAPAPQYSREIEARGGDRLYTGEKLPEANGVRPEYAQSGQWIAQPGQPGK